MPITMIRSGGIDTFIQRARSKDRGKVWDKYRE